MATIVQLETGAVQKILDYIKTNAESITSILTTANDASTKINTFLNDATLTGTVIDTLKELQDYISSHGTAASELINRVTAVETAVATAQTTADDASSAAAAVDSKLDAIQIDANITVKTITADQIAAYYTNSTSITV